MLFVWECEKNGLETQYWSFPEKGMEKVWKNGMNWSELIVNGFQLENVTTKDRYSEDIVQRTSFSKSKDD